MPPPIIAPENGDPASVPTPVPIIVPATVAHPDSVTSAASAAAASSVRFIVASWRGGVQRFVRREGPGGRDPTAHAGGTHAINAHAARTVHTEARAALRATLSGPRIAA